MTDAPRKVRRPKAKKKPGSLSKRMQGGPPAHREAVKNAKAEEQRLKRRREAWRLFTEDGLTFRQIGERQGTSEKTAWQDVDDLRKEMRKEGMVADAEMLRERQAAIYEVVRKAHMGKLGKKQSADVVMVALAQEAKLLGLNRQADDNRGYSPEQVGNLVTMMMQGLLLVFTAAADRQKLIGVLDQVAPQFLPAPTDATPTKET